MSLPRYAEYKDSGIAWLGELPAHWDVWPLKRGLRLLTEKTDQRTFPIALENIESWTGRFLATDSTFEGDGVAFDSGDILFGKLRPYLAKALLVSASGQAVGDFHVLRPKSNMYGRFYQYHLLNRDFISIVDGSTFGARMPRASWDFMAQILLTVPTRPEQVAIATFLDRETAKIDALIAEQERLIALLAEKRQAVISHAVTKGLNPAAPMKDSGIEWLGEVPAHWEVKQIKYLARSIEQGWSPQCEGFPVASSDEWGVLKVGCVNGGVFNAEENKTLPDNLEPMPELSIRAGDLLISRANTRELVGGAAVPDRDYPNLMLCDKLYRLRLDLNQINPSLVSFYLGADGARSWIELNATGASSSMQNIGQSTILEMPMPIPPLVEQGAIVQSLKTELERVVALAAEAHRAIDLLKEHRAALISAAVTGKIDVRGLVAAAA